MLSLLTNYEWTEIRKNSWLILAEQNNIESRKFLKILQTTNIYLGAEYIFRQNENPFSLEHYVGYNADTATGRCWFM